MELRPNSIVREMDPAIMEKKDFSEANPNRDPEKPCLYVGMTSKTPEERFEVHKSEDIKRSRKVHKYGIRLLPHLYEHINPLTWAEAVEMEKDLAEALRSQGYAVWQR